MMIESGPSVRYASAITEIGRAHVCTPVTNAHLACRLLPEKKKTKTDQYHTATSKHNDEQNYYETPTRSWQHRVITQNMRRQQTTIFLTYQHTAIHASRARIRNRRRHHTQTTIHNYT